MVDPCARHDSNVRPLLPLGAGCRPRSLRDAAQSSSGISFSTTPGPSRRGAQSGASSIETPTLRSHCYGLLHAILGTAASHGKLAASPCNVKGAGNTKRVEKIRPASLPELEKITAEMPAQYAAMILLAAWCAMRFGELTELGAGVTSSSTRTRATVLSASSVRWCAPTAAPGHDAKSDAGTRDVAIPPHLVPVLAEQLAKHVGPEQDSLLFLAKHGGYLAPSTLYRQFYKAREKAGRPDLRIHELRHTGGTLTAHSGATLAELMGRLGHSSPQAALRYQHIASGRDEKIAEALSKIALGS